MGLQKPFYGPIFVANVQRSGSTVHVGSSFRVRGVEAEYVFQIGKEIPCNGAGRTTSSSGSGGNGSGFQPYRPEEIIGFVEKVSLA